MAKMCKSQFTTKMTQNDSLSPYKREEKQKQKGSLATKETVPQVSPRAVVSRAVFVVLAIEIPESRTRPTPPAGLRSLSTDLGIAIHRGCREDVFVVGVSVWIAVLDRRMEWLSHRVAHKRKEDEFGRTANIDSLPQVDRTFTEMNTCPTSCKTHHYDRFLFFSMADGANCTAAKETRALNRAAENCYFKMG